MSAYRDTKVTIDQLKKELALKKSCLMLVTTLLLAVGADAAPKADYWAFWDRSDETSQARIDHSAWDALLARYVVADGSGINRFDYVAFDRSDEKRLRAYVDSLAAVDPRQFNRLEAEAYWMNLYNALSVFAIRENYDVIAGQSDRRVAALEKAWDKGRVKIAGQKLSLNDIEHRILRPIWKDHRIHFGLNCATLGCPNMLPRALTGATLKSQLRAAGRQFVNDERGVHYADGKLRVSRLFDWYRDDFASDQKGLLKLFAYYADDSKALYLLGYGGEIDYAYDWDLNSP